mmetsp:Transcript_18182/g.41791  ORF Transcript_18182/g.41791 Transcript_18182/m.41791 type:complete len:120 (-) Transcript_18182:13-372(-)
MRSATKLPSSIACTISTAANPEWGQVQTTSVSSCRLQHNIEHMFPSGCWCSTESTTRVVAAERTTFCPLTATRYSSPSDEWARLLRCAAPRVVLERLVHVRVRAIVDRCQAVFATGCPI